MELKSKTVRGVKVNYALFSSKESAEAFSRAAWTPSNVLRVRGGWAVVAASSPWERP